jgi:hypothetical protein
MKIKKCWSSKIVHKYEKQQVGVELGSSREQLDWVVSAFPKIHSVGI